MLILLGSLYTYTIEQNDHVDYTPYGLPVYVISPVYAVSEFLDHFVGKLKYQAPKISRRSGDCTLNG